jgi:hypothetical protein
MSYDFKAFLSSIDPSQTYECQLLTGGLVNITVRATKTSPPAQGTFPDYETMVLKYAPPYVAALGEATPFSQDRQVYFASDPSNYIVLTDLLS